MVEGACCKSDSSSIPGTPVKVEEIAHSITFFPTLCTCTVPHHSKNQFYLGTFESLIQSELSFDMYIMDSCVSEVYTSTAILAKLLEESSKERL